MALIKRGDIWHYDFCVENNRYRGSTGFRDKKKALEFHEQERGRIALGSGYSGGLTLQAVSAVWFEAKAADKKSAVTTARRLKTVLRLLGPSTLITTIDTPHVAEAISKRRMEPTIQTKGSKAPRPPTNSTINRDLIDSTLRPIMRYARRVLKLPVKDIIWTDVRLDEPDGRVRSFSAAEIEAFRSHLPIWHQPVFDFISKYGVRLQEAFFSLDALDLDAGRVTLRKRKRGPDHTIPLLPEDVRILAALAGRARGAKLNTVWIREHRNGKLTPIHWRGYQGASQTAVRNAGLIDARPVHDLRHHAGTAILRSTGNLAVARKLLGHKDIKSTARYAHAYDSDVLDALRHTHDTTPVAAKKSRKKINE